MYCLSILWLNLFLPVPEATVQIKENNYSIDNANYETIGALSLLHGNTTDQTLIESFDVEGKL